jgi:hypothetical protein
LISLNASLIGDVQIVSFDYSRDKLNFLVNVHLI